MFIKERIHKIKYVKNKYIYGVQCHIFVSSHLELAQPLGFVLTAMLLCQRTAELLGDSDRKDSDSEGKAEKPRFRQCHAPSKCSLEDLLISELLVLLAFTNCCFVSYIFPCFHMTCSSFACHLLFFDKDI